MVDTVKTKKQVNVSEIDPVKIIAFTKLSVTLSCAWPPSSQANKFQILAFDILWTLSFLSCLLCSLSLFNALTAYPDDPLIFADSMFFLVSSFHITGMMLVCRVNRKEFQAVLEELENFCKHAEFDERNVLQRYVDKYAVLYGCFAVLGYFASVVFTCLPMFTSREFPTYAKYPFSKNNFFQKVVVYIHQCVVAFQASSSVCITCEVALLLFYMCIKFELLGTKLENVTKEHELDNCIEIHCSLIRYAKLVETAIHLLVLSVVIVTSLGIIFAGYNFLINDSIMIRLQYVAVSCIAALELFMYAWPADNLSSMTTNICQAAYKSRWVTQPLSMQRKVICLMLRSQKPQAIKIANFLPYLSLQYYSSFLYSSLSYFTALRVIMATDELD